MKPIYLTCIALLFIATACTKDFLDVDNTQNLYSESYVKDLTSMQEYVNGVYYMVSNSIESGERESTYPELVADNMRPVSSSSSPTFASLYNWTQDASDVSSNLFQIWQRAYATTRMCSFAIDNVNKFRDEDPAKADDIAGQALALRAYVYFKLVNMFAQPYAFTADASHPGVPYIITSDITQSYRRQSVAEVYEGMIADLTRAIEVLPTSVKDCRYMNINAAKALLARVYLFSEDYSNAKILATEITNTVPLMTIAAGYPNDMFKFKAPATTETLFQISPPSRFTNFLGRYIQITPIKYVATNDIAQMFTQYPNDVRKNWVIKDASNLWNIVKFPKGVAPEVTAVASVPGVAYYPALLRSSEMFLTVAEAAAQTGDENTARTYLDAIRKRANPTIPAVVAGGSALLDSIYKERRKELAFEGLRMFDLQRCKKGIQRTDVLPSSPAVLPFPNNKAVSPIPIKEILLSGIDQNQSY